MNQKQNTESSPDRLHWLTKGPTDYVLQDVSRIHTSSIADPQSWLIPRTPTSFVTLEGM